MERGVDHCEPTATQTYRDIKLVAGDDFGASVWSTALARLAETLSVYPGNRGPFGVDDHVSSGGNEHRCIAIGDDEVTISVQPLAVGASDDDDEEGIQSTDSLPDLVCK